MLMCSEKDMYYYSLVCCCQPLATSSGLGLARLHQVHRRESGNVHKVHSQQLCAPMARWRSQPVDDDDDDDEIMPAIQSVLGRPQRASSSGG